MPVAANKYSQLKHIMDKNDEGMVGMEVTRRKTMHTLSALIVMSSPTTSRDVKSS